MVAHSCKQLNDPILTQVVMIMTELNQMISNSLRSMHIDHICLNVPNYLETLQWYQEKLDATVTREWTVDVFPDLKLVHCQNLILG
jgi:catechol-2,3-dioxygenase